MPNEFYPGLPTQYARQGKRSYTNDDLVARKPFTVEVEQSPAMKALYDNEPSVDDLLADAKGELAEAPSSYNRYAQTQGTDAVSAQVQERLEREAQNERANAANTAVNVASFAPGPLGLAARAAQSIEGAADIYAEGPNAGNIGQAAAIGFDAIRAIQALRDSRSAAREIAGRIATNTGVKHGPFRPSSPYAPATGPTQAITNPSVSRPSSIAALADDSAEGLGTGQIDLTGALDELGEASLSPDQIARARAAERFGRTFRSEQTVPRARYVGMQEDDVPFEMFEYEIAPGQWTTGATAEDLIAKGIPVPPVDAPVDKSKINNFISQLFGHDLPPSVQARVSRMSPTEALADESAIGMSRKGNPIRLADVEDDNVLFGGATSRQFGSGPEAGDFVRPKHRTPIGKRPNPPSWRFGREEAVQWNQ